MQGAFPSLVEWALTDACDLQCRHCYARRRRSKAAELSPAEADRLARDLADRGVRRVTLSGGEALLRPDWSAIAGRLNERGIEVHLISNGWTLDLAVARRARAVGVRQVLLSLDGLEATHDAVRGQEGAYQAVLRAARALQTAGLPFAVLTTLLAVNRSEIEALGRRVEALGARVWQVWLGIPQDRSELWLAPAAIPAVVRQLVALRHTLPILRLGDNLGTGCEDGSMRVWTTAGGEVVSPRPTARRGFRGCEAGRRVLGIRSDGTITGCLALPVERDLGTIRERTIDELAVAAAVDRTFRHRRLAGRCRSCSAAGPCGGGCHATALAATGRIENPYCERMPGRGESAAVRGRLAAAATGLAACLTFGGLGVGCRNSGSSIDGRADAGPTRESGTRSTVEAVACLPDADAADKHPEMDAGTEPVPPRPSRMDAAPGLTEDVVEGDDGTEAADAGDAASAEGTSEAQGRNAARDAGFAAGRHAPNSHAANSALPFCCMSHMLPGPDCRCGGSPPVLLLQPPDAEAPRDAAPGQADAEPR